MKRYLLIFILIFVGFLALSQSDSLKKDRYKFIVTLDLRNELMYHNINESYGLKLGVGNKRLRFGIASHIFHRNLFSVFETKDFFRPPTVGHYQTIYYTVSIFSELILHQTTRWELIVPIHFGIGRMNLDADKSGILYVRSPDLDYRKKTEWVESAVVSLKANYRIVKWVGLTSGFGYNFAFSNDKNIQSSFSNIFYSFGLKLFFDEFGKLVKDKEYRKKYLFKTNFVND